MRRRAFLIAALACVGLAGCSRAPAPVGGPGAGAARLAVLSPALAVTLRDLGLGDRIVGRHAYDLVLDEAVPVCGDQAGIDYEALLAARPTHVLLEWGARPLPARLQELGAAHGWQVRNFTLLSLEQVRGCAEALSAEFAGAGSTTAGASPLVVEMDRAWSRRADGFGGAGRVLLLHSSRPPGVLGPGSFHHEILVRLGGTPAITEGAPFIELDTEDVLRLAPDAIVMIMPGPRTAVCRATPPGRDELLALLGPLGGADIPAVRRGRIALIDDPLCALPSSSMIALADELAEVLGRWGGAESRPGP